MPSGSADYDQSYYRSRESWPDFRMEAELIARLAYRTSGTRVLDVGCGSGELLRRLAIRSRLAVGIDLSVDGLQMARSRTGAVGLNSLKLLNARAESLPFKDATFDAVVAQHLLEHIHNPKEALREWRRVLRPGGVVAMVTPNALYPDPTIFDDPSHVNLFTPDTLRFALESAGFEVLHLFSLFPYLGRGRIARSLSIRLALVARRLPGFNRSGRSLIAAALA